MIAASPSPVRSVLRRRGFALYWSGQVVSLTGGWMQQLALSWVVLDLTSDAFHVGLINFLAALPPAALLLHGGLFADRFNKRRILITTQILFAAGALGLSLLVSGGGVRLWHVAGFSVLLGVVFAFDLPASQAFVAELVPAVEIAPAVQLMQVAFHGSRLIGPAMGGWLVSRYGSAAAFAANAASFLPVIVTLLLVRPLRSTGARGGERPSIGGGIEHVRRRPALLALLGITAATTFFVFPSMVVLMPFYARQGLGLDAWAVGALMTATGAGAFVGSLSLLHVRPERRHRRIGASFAAAALGLLLLWLALWLPLPDLRTLPGRLALAVSGSAFLALSVSSAMGLVAIILQESVPDELRGRVMSLQSLVFMGTLPLASLLITSLVDWIGLGGELLLAAAGYSACGLWLLVRMQRHPVHVLG